MEKESYDYIIINAGTNNSITRTSEEMLVDTMELKQYVENTYHSKVIISNIIGRLDDSKANITIRHFNEELSKLDITIMDNSSITSKHLGKRGLHLTSPHGSGRLAMNLINLIRGS